MACHGTARQGKARQGKAPEYGTSHNGPHGSWSDLSKKILLVLVLLSLRSGIVMVGWRVV